MINVLSVIIFLIVLFFYLHIIFEFKVNNSLEVLSSEFISKNNFEEICNLKQPTLFNYNNTQLCNIFLRENLINNYKIFDLNIQNINNNKKNIYKLNLVKTFNLFDKDPSQNYITEKNHEFIKETNINKKIKELTHFLKPSLNVKTNIDILSGSINSYTQLKYNISCRNFFYIPSGNVEVKLIPPKYTNYLDEYKDYEHFEFSSPINIWNTQGMHFKNIQKIKQLNFIINQHNILYIQPYWWYSFKFLDKSNIVYFNFNTCINITANIKHYILNVLQNQNIENKKHPTLNINSNNQLKKSKKNKKQNKNKIKTKTKGKNMKNI